MPELIEELMKLEILIRDLRLGLEIQKDIENNCVNPIAIFNDGEKVILSATPEIKLKLDVKVKTLKTLFKLKTETILAMVKDASSM